MEKTIDIEITEMKLEELNKVLSRIFKVIGTNKSKQRLAYDLLNILKVKDHNRFMNIILKQINNISLDDERYIEDKNKAIDILSYLYNTYSNSEEFEKIGYTIVMSIIKTINVDKGGENE